MPINAKHRAERRSQKAERYRKRVPLQPDGQPQGKHLQGFKGMKIDEGCQCGACHPNAKANKDKVIYR